MRCGVVCCAAALRLLLVWLARRSSASLCSCGALHCAVLCRLRCGCCAVMSEAPFSEFVQLRCAALCCAVLPACSALACCAAVLHRRRQTAGAAGGAAVPCHACPAVPPCCAILPLLCCPLSPVQGGHALFLRRHIPHAHLVFSRQCHNLCAGRTRASHSLTQTWAGWWEPTTMKSMPARRKEARRAAAARPRKVRRSRLMQGSCLVAGWLAAGVRQL